MHLKKENILFFTRTMELGGTENVILQLCEILQPEVRKIVVCSCGGVNVGKLDKMGIRHYRIPDIESKRPQDMLKVVKVIKYIIGCEQITVIHTHHRMAAFYVTLLGLYKKCVFLNTSHNTFYNKRYLTRVSYKKAYLIACGEMVKKNLTGFFGLPDNKIMVVHNAVKAFDSEIVCDPLINKLHENGSFIVGNIGRLSEQKGMEYFIRAIPSVTVKHPEANFLIIGSGDCEEKLKSLVAELELTDRVIFLGYRTDIQNIMSQLDLIVLSSLWEGLPLTPIEAFSVGKTIVATDVDGTIEIVEDGVSGLLVEPRHPKQIAEKINWIIEHPNEKYQMEIAGKKRFVTEFSFAVFREKYINCYKDAVENRK